MKIIRSFVLIFAIFLTSCARMTTPTETPTTAPSWESRKLALSQIQSWQVKGKIGVRTARDAGSATVDWQQSHEHYVIALYGPLGTQGIKLTGQPGTVTLETSEGKHITANSPEQLLAKQWGFNVPVSNLQYWIRGLPVPNVPFQSHFDSSNRLTQLNQEGWIVQYLGYAKEGSTDLPNRLAISSPSLRTKIVIYTWRIS